LAFGPDRDSAQNDVQKVAVGKFVIRFKAKFTSAADAWIIIFLSVYFNSVAVVKAEIIPQSHPSGFENFRIRDVHKMIRLSL